jgi:hypothetical protein
MWDFLWSWMLSLLCYASIVLMRVKIRRLGTLRRIGLILNGKEGYNPNYEYVPDEYDLLKEYIEWLLNINGCETGIYITDKGSYIFGIKFKDVGTVYKNKFTSVSSLVTMITEGRAKFLEEMSRLGADLSRIQLQPMEWPNDEENEKWGPIFVENPEPMVFTWDN